MGNSYLGAALTLLAVIALWVQTRRIVGQPWRKRAFTLAAGAGLALAGYNLLRAADSGPGALITFLLWAGFLLLGAAAVAFLLAVRGGELRAGRSAFEATMRAEGLRRRQAAEQQQKHNKR